LTASGFREGLDLVAQAATLVEHSLNRATTITGSFKHVAADQSHAEIREFDLGAYLEEIVNSLQPLFRHGRHTVKLQLEPGILLQGNPASFYQIISNLIINSINHGFEGREAGQVSIGVRQEGDQVLLDYRDNGIGMDEQQKSRMYEPFFTTKRASGGTGLGMSIIYSLVHEDLGGSIQCETAPGEGVHFAIRFPQVKPPKEAS
jgi:signal transduction histidine kinase